MIQYLQIIYMCENIKHTLAIPTDDENLPFNLAEAFKEIIDKTNANEEIVLRELMENYGIEQKDETDD